MNLRPAMTVLAAALAGAIASSVFLLLAGLVVRPFDPLLAFAYAALSLTYSVSGSLIVGVPLFLIVKRIWRPSWPMIVIVSAMAGLLWAAITERSSAKPVFLLVGATLGAIGGLVASLILLRSNSGRAR